MRYLDLRGKIEENAFTFLDVIKYFPEESLATVRAQLSRFEKRGLLKRIKRGFYCFDERQIDELVLANQLYQPSYVSLETALNFYGLIPDVSQMVTSVTLTTTKRVVTEFGSFSYTKIKPELFFGFRKLESSGRGVFFQIAEKEKALLDYFYTRQIKIIADLRLDLRELDRRLYREYKKSFPPWVQEIRL